MVGILLRSDWGDIWKEHRSNIVITIVLATGVILNSITGLLSGFFAYVFNWFYSDDMSNLLAGGLMTTITISFVSILSGTLSGFLLAYLFRAVQMRFAVVVRVGAWIFFYAALAMPAYLLLYWGTFFVFPRATPWWVATGALGLNLAVFVAKIVYGGFGTVPLAQIEAARTAGASGLTLAAGFEIPAILRSVGSAIAVEWATTLKLSSLVGVVGAHDIMWVATQNATLSYDQGIYLVVPVVYFVLVSPILLWSEHLRKSI